MPTYPLLDKTWQYNVNQTLPTQSSVLAASQNLLWQIVNSFTSFSPGWQVRGASNSTTSGLLALTAAGPYTGSGAWTGGGSCVWGSTTTAHSWIVLRNTALCSGYPEILISCDSSGTNSCTVILSPSAGFTGGSTTSDPTATDQIQLGNGGTANIGYGSTNTNVQYALHVEMSTDGQCTRMWVFSGGSFQELWIIDALKNPSTGWTTPWVMHTAYLTPSTTSYWESAADTYGGVNNLNHGGYVGGTPNANPAWTSFYWTGEGPSNLIVLAYNAPNDLNSLYPMPPIGLFVPPSGPLRGRHGMWFDLWWGVAALSTGQLYAGAAAHAYVQIGAIILPWSGAATMNTS